MPLPEALLRLALVGTAQSGQKIPQLGNELQTLLKQMDAAPERQLLLTIAGLDLRQRAGWVPPHAENLTSSPSPPDPRPVIGYKASRHLQFMLKGAYKELLEEWLEVVAASGKRVPDELTP